jgi:hypothetical protein
MIMQPKARPREIELFPNNAGFTAKVTLGQPDERTGMTCLTLTTVVRDDKTDCWNEARTTQLFMTPEALAMLGDFLLTNAK